jgi:radical SAM superfamily enzyme YgiQ (UPF0313 family)
MRYEGTMFRPPSEHDAYILQATIGCSWNKCTYCAMYIDKVFRTRPTEEILEDIAMAQARLGSGVEKVFVADGDALVMSMEQWEPLLKACRAAFPRLRRVSCYAMASNILAKTDDELAALSELGLKMLYVGPESGDDVTLDRIAKGGTAADHALAAQRAKAAGMALSVIFLLGAGGVERSSQHAVESARLATAMDPEFLSALTLTVLDGTRMGVAQRKGRFELPDVNTLLGELRTFLATAELTNAVFRTNHASNYLPIGGRLPQDRDAMLAALDAALAGEIRLRPEWARGL